MIVGADDVYYYSRMMTIFYFLNWRNSLFTRAVQIIWGSEKLVCSIRNNIIQFYQSFECYVAPESFNVDFFLNKSQFYKILMVTCSREQVPKANWSRGHGVSYQKKLFLNIFFSFSYENFVFQTLSENSLRSLRKEQSLKEWEREGESRKWANEYWAPSPWRDRLYWCACNSKLSMYTDAQRLVTGCA